MALDAGTANEVCDITITVTGEAVAFRRGTLLYEDAVEQRSVCRFTVVDVAGALRFTKGEAVTVADATGTLFTGFVERAVERRGVATRDAEMTVVLLHELTCVDNHYLADKRTVVEAYSATLAGDIVTDLHTRYLADEGITLGTIEDGPLVEAAIFPYVSAAVALQELASRAGFWWRIDHNRVLDFQSRESVAAPWTLTLGDVAAGSLRVTATGQRYRNRQYVRGGRDITDPQTEQFAGDGERTTFTVGFPMAYVPTVTLNGGAQTVGIKGVETGKDWYWNKNETTITQDSAGTVLTTGDLLAITYQGFYPVVALVEDPAEITARQAVEGVGTGLVEWVEEDATLESRAAAVEAAQARIEAYAQVGKLVEFETARPGLAAGQSLPVTVTEHGLSAESFLVELVEGRDAGGVIVYSVRAVQGAEYGSWTRFFADLHKRASSIDLLTVGQEEVLARLASFADTWAWGESVTQDVASCPVPLEDQHLLLDGTSGTYASTPDHADLDVTGDIDIRCKVALDDWSPATNQTFVSKWDGQGLRRSYNFALQSNSRLILQTTPNGSTVSSAQSTVAPPFADGAISWLRATLDVDNGAAGQTATFYTSTDGVTWQQLGAPVVTAGTTSIFSGSEPVAIGASAAGEANRFAGKLYSVEVRNGIDGTIVANPDFAEPTEFDPDGTTGTDSTGKLWTLNGNADLIASIHPSETLFPC